MNNNKLALFGGKPIRTKEFSSKPMIDNSEIDLVVELMKKNQFSKFVGSPIPGTNDIIGEKSSGLEQEDVSPNILGGEYVRKFEAFWSQITKADYCISVNSATSGLTTSLLALGLEPGSEVITTPFSFSATCAAIVAANCVPIFCDIDPDTFCLSPMKLGALITEKTKCVLTVHWCGNAGDIGKIKEICDNKGVYLVEDAAQAPTSYYKSSAIGTIGDIGIFSFNEPKNIMAGEGGLIVTNSKSLAIKCRLIRNHGEAIVDDSYNNEQLVNVIGYNFRLTEIQAAIAYIQSKKHQKINKIRLDNYRYLVNEISSNFHRFLTPQKITHPDSYYAYTASFKWNYNNSGVHRDAVVKALIAEGIPVFKGYHRLMCDHPMFKRKIAFGRNNFPWTSSNIDYNKIDVSNARHLVDNEFLGFLQVGYPNNKSDMDDILSAFSKIINNLGELKSYKIRNKEINIGR